LNLALIRHATEKLTTSAENNIDKNAAAALATNQPSDHENDKETTKQPIVDSTTTVRETNVEND